jgi:uncharacterized membrane protein YvlD (DUF360 family)
LAKFLLSALAYVIANAVGLLLALVILPGFSISALSFVIAVLVFSAVEALATSLISRFGPQKVPQLEGGIALITAALGLLVTDFFMAGMQLGGVSNWLAATLLVWLGSLVAAILLPIYVFPSLRAAAPKP